MEERPDPYAVLGIESGASADAIRKAYYELARTTHPDIVGDQGLDEMRRLNAAWDALGHPSRRAGHDAGQAPNSEPQAEAGASAATGTTRSRQPFWTGSAGPPPGRPSGSRLDFGIYAGWTLGEILRHDGGYLVWLLDRREGRRHVEEIRQLLDRVRPPAGEPARPRGRWRR